MCEANGNYCVPDDIACEAGDIRGQGGACSKGKTCCLQKSKPGTSIYTIPVMGEECEGLTKGATCVDTNSICSTNLNQMDCGTGKKCGISCRTPNPPLCLGGVCVPNPIQPPPAPIQPGSYDLGIQVTLPTEKINPGLDPAALGPLAINVAEVIKACQKNFPGIYGQELGNCFCANVSGGCPPDSPAKDVEKVLVDDTQTGAQKGYFQCVEFVCTVMNASKNGICSCAQESAFLLAQNAQQCIDWGNDSDSNTHGIGVFQFCTQFGLFKPGDIPIMGTQDPGHIGICNTGDGQPSPLCDLAEANYATKDGSCKSNDGCVDNQRKIDKTGVIGIWRIGSCF